MSLAIGAALACALGLGKGDQSVSHATADDDSVHLARTTSAGTGHLLQALVVTIADRAVRSLGIAHL